VEKGKCWDPSICTMLLEMLTCSGRGSTNPCLTHHTFLLQDRTWLQKIRSLPLLTEAEKLGRTSASSSSFHSRLRC
jgi:hypothetical protein